MNGVGLLLFLVCWWLQCALHYLEIARLRRGLDDHAAWTYERCERLAQAALRREIERKRQLAEIAQIASASERRLADRLNTLERMILGVSAENRKLEDRITRLSEVRLPARDGADRAYDTFRGTGQ